MSTKPLTDWDRLVTAPCRRRAALADGATTTRVAAVMAAAAERKVQLDQFFTSPAIVGLRGGLLAVGTRDACRVLDAKPPGNEVPRLYNDARFNGLARGEHGCQPG